MVVLLSDASISQSYPSIAEVKYAKSAATVMIKCGVKPIDASYHSIGKLCKWGSEVLL